MAANVLREITQEEHMRAKRRSQRMYETDMTNKYLVGKAEGEAKGIKKGRTEGIKKGEARGLKKGRAEGKAEGRAEGKAEGIFTMAKNMLKEGVPVETIIKVTGLTHKEVEQMRNNP